jgi:ribosome maturation factor RimP
VVDGRVAQREERVDVGEAVAATNAGGGRDRARSRRPGAAGRRPGPDVGEVSRLLAPELATHGYDLEDVAIIRAGSRSVVRIVVDRDEGIDLDAAAAASRVVSAVLDAAEARCGPGGGVLPPGPYVLEVSSPGVDRPLVAPRHWRRAQGRLVSAHTRDGRQVLGRVRAAGPHAVELAVDDPAGPAGAVVRIPFADVVRAAVQVEFRATSEDPAAGVDADQDADAEAGR